MSDEGGLNRLQSTESLRAPKRIPWIASPLNEKLLDTPLESLEQPTLNANDRAAELNGQQLHQCDTHGTSLFREHYDSSTVELFYDLFFVANLATFTANHEIVDVSSLKNYLGLFTILWFTWLETSLFDVRFSADSVFNRVCKAVSFGIMTCFAISGAMYDTTSIEENAKAFRAMALILMVSRLALVGQYGVVLFYVKQYKTTVWPLASTMGALFVAAMIFLGTFWGFSEHSKDDASIPTENGGSHTYVVWYTVIGVEALVVISISCYWRVVSFRHTHLVERIGLLTLIIMGEGIVGMTKSVSTMLRSSATVNSGDMGTVAAAVLLIYFIWILYFDQIEHDRFGTIRQQIWAFLHFPLHVAILLTVEGSTTLIVWNTIKRLTLALVETVPFGDGDPATGFSSTAALVNYTRQAITDWAGNFKNFNLSASFDYNAKLTELLNIEAPFNSTEWINEANAIEADLWDGLFVTLFHNFDIEAPKSATASSSATNETTQTNNEINAISNIFETVFYYYYISAGAFLMVLAVMYYFGKTHKSRGEHFSILVRVLAGAGVMVGLISGDSNLNSSLHFDFSSWMIPVVTVGYFVVIVLDSLLVRHTSKTIATQTSLNKQQQYKMVSGGDTGTDKKRGNPEVITVSGDNSV